MPAPTKPLDPAAIGARIRAERERLELSQERAAELLGIGRSTYRQLEARANPQAATLLGLVRLGMRLDAILPELLKR